MILFTYLGKISVSSDQSRMNGKF